MPLDLPQEVQGKMARSLRPFMSAEVDLEAVLAHMLINPSLTKRQHRQLAMQAHAAVDRAVTQASADVEAVVKLAYLRGARKERVDFTLGETDEDRVAFFREGITQDLRLAHIAVDRRLHDASRQMQLLSVARAGEPNEATGGLLGTVEARLTQSRRPWSLLQHARAALAATCAAAFQEGVTRTANQPVYGM